jgi:hypothetical protein
MNMETTETVNKTESVVAVGSTDGLGIRRKIYCFNNGGSSGWMSAVAIAEDGHCLAGHTCSHEGYMRHDLGMDGSTWKHENYDKHYGAGNWELEWVENPKKHEGIQKAFALNALLPKPKEGEDV